MRRFFLAHPDPDCIRPLLQSFGRWGGRGVYQLVPTVLAPFTFDQVRAPLVEALESPHDAIRYWACQVAQEKPAPEALTPLLNCLTDQNLDIRMAAASALEFLGARRPWRKVP